MSRALATWMNSPDRSKRESPAMRGTSTAASCPFGRVLHDAGYHTYWAGKSQYGYYEPSPARRDGIRARFHAAKRRREQLERHDVSQIPRTRASISRSMANHWKLFKNHFSSEAYSDFILKCVEENKDRWKTVFWLPELPGCPQSVRRAR